MPMIKLQSSDDEVFQVDFEIAKASGIIKTIVEYFGQEGEYKEIITAEVIKETLNTKNDFTSDEVEQVRKQIESYEEE